MKCAMDCSARPKYRVGIPGQSTQTRMTTCGKHMAFFVKVWLENTGVVEVTAIPKEER